MHIVDLILKKRAGNALTKEEIQYLVKNYTNGTIKDYQMSSFLMTLFFQGMNDEEATNLALSMRDSGDVFDLSKINGIKVDKHSTGGVGDKVTLILAPLLAAHGAKVAKMSGRGLGHTGGTIDKLESIPGFKTELSFEDFERQVNEIGLSVIGQSGDVAPADKKLYALRDVTGTVDIIPLIASSIMSKKLASGSDAICLDVKVGSGAFMKTLDEAKKLAKLMVNIGKLAGKKVTAILTSMDEPLGHKIGNGLEVFESIETMNGKGPRDVVEVTTTIGAQLLLDAKIETDFEVAKRKLAKSLHDGKALNKFREMVIAQGGDVSYVDNPSKLITDKTVEVKSTKEGYITKIDALGIGVAASRLGAGRETKEDVIDLKVGLDLHKKIGDKVKVGDVLVTLYVSEKGVEEATELIKKSITIGSKKQDFKLILGTVK
ncbi:pyrimidine-nucleoside phosphorylase [Haploplasma axanthum]|uniref:Pyrimidine-nucleoside phosphorylase n=1 Tax=Haploplasma axanthum TaxID=29552 RepID=A0A449BEG2_HAPAX|nr:pyrimidine-nucleoside phosphorylase [Haploplasma axanthum]VEU80812.1 Pyrimidine-nucleoside phosphorylase [Haploplasma axanthum]